MLPCRNNKGFVILVVLIFMQIIVLLNWYSIENVLFLTKFTGNMATHDMLYHQAARLLDHVKDVGLTDCQIPVTESENIVSESLNWWKSEGCSGNFSRFKYYYVVEGLGVDPCAVIDPLKKTVAAWFRATIYLIDKKGNARIFLQGTFVEPGTTSEHCVGLMHPAESGRQSLRELNY